MINIAAQMRNCLLTHDKLLGPVARAENRADEKR
jgi:hypothetical protein